MKMFFVLFFLPLISIANGPGYINDFDYQLTDISKQGLTKENLFQKMERNMLDLEKSICANRAHLWAWDFFRLHRIKAGKIFIFFGASIWTNQDKRGYMYHVAPYILENGNEFVMEASYPSEINKPLTIEEWIESETYGRVKAKDCLEINASDTDLTEYFFARYNLPLFRESGKKGARCYFRKVPGHYWFPTSIAWHDLKVNEEGKTIHFDPQSFEQEDIMHACLEASVKTKNPFVSKKAQCKSRFRLSI